MEREPGPGRFASLLFAHSTSLLIGRKRGLEKVTLLIDSTLKALISNQRCPLSFQPARSLSKYCLEACPGSSCALFTDSRPRGGQSRGRTWFLEPALWSWLGATPRILASAPDGAGRGQGEGRFPPLPKPGKERHGHTSLSEGLPFLPAPSFCPRNQVPRP